jgi:hypothetical protein
VKLAPDPARLPLIVHLVDEIATVPDKAEGAALPD